MCKHIGNKFLLFRPILVLHDVELIKSVLVKDFDHFTDRRAFEMDTNSLGTKILSNMMTSLKGEQWKQVRSAMSPAFTSGKLKAMAPLINKVGDELSEFLAEKAESGEDFNGKDTLTMYTLDCLSTCGFGVESNSFKEPDGDFRSMVLQITGGGKPKPSRIFNSLLYMLVPALARALRLSVIDEEAMAYFANAVCKAVKHRQDTKQRRGDLIDLVLEAMEKSEKSGLVKSEEDIEKEQFEKDAEVKPDQTDIKMSKEENELLMVSNAIVLFFAGYETTAASTTMALAFLSKHPDLQEKLFQELNDAKERSGSQDLDYQDVKDLKYLEQVLNETLRFYFSSTTERLCTKEYKLPGTDFVVPKDMIVQISSRDIHKDDQYYPDPDNFNPEENFSAEARAARSPYTFLGFGQGPRNCIGMRFAHMMFKLCLAKVLLSYVFLPGDKMPEKFELGLASAMPKGGIWFKVRRRE